VDVDAFEGAARTARRYRAPEAYRVAIDLYAGDLLPENRYETWAEDRRGELRQLYLALIIGLAGLHEERGELEPAVEALSRAVAEEPTLEEAHAGLMRLYAASDRPERAIAQYERLHETSANKLGTHPSAATRRLRDEIAAGTYPQTQPLPKRPASQEKDAAVGADNHNLPAQRTSFVGRERELAEVKRALATTRLVTLTGTGGSGKTRLALEAARDLTGAYPDGVWFVQLAGLSDGGLLPSTVAEALGVPERPGQPLTDTLVDALRAKQTLLVLDNCEHLVAPVARLVDVLLDSCPNLRILATSREVLRVAGEGDRRIPPLSVPDPRRRTSAEELERYESVKLFVERAGARNPAFALTPHNAQFVAQICERLGGVPLAIELAAARAGLSVRQIAARLDESLRLLTAGSRTASPRQRTLRRTLDWSYDLLSEPEQALFNRLSIFAGGWTLQAVEEVGAGDGIERQEVLDLLLRLVDKSLVATETTGEQELRYGLLEPVRQYAREKLEESGEAEAVRSSHARFFLDLAERAAPELKGRRQVEWLARLEEDNDNLRVAMGWLLGHGEIEAAVRMAWDLWMFWLIHGHQSEGRGWIGAALAKGENLTARARARALWVRATMHYGLGDPELVEESCRESAALFRRVGDKAGLAHALSGQASVSTQRGDAEQAITLYEESIELGRETGESWGVSGALAHLGLVHLGQGRHEQAARCLEEGLALSREVGNRLTISAALIGLALAERGRGAHARAAELYAEGLAASIEAGDKANIAYCLEGLAQVAVAQGKLERAAQLFGAAETSLEAAGGVLYSHAQDDRRMREKAMNAIHSQLDERAYLSIWAEGAAMSPAETLEYALEPEEGVSRPSPTVPAEPSSDNALDDLTRREREVAALVARGLTNRQIASELAISEHTVATHVGKIMRKLGLSSRSQLAAWVAEQLAPPSLGSD
jgi:predicted ATPase/DNA-binding CsgD family transcriptional regulator